jgi:[ribosomal protein S18]-alanine N-acetyltransferase
VIRPAAEPDIPRIVEIERSSYADPWKENLFTGALGADGKYLFVDEQRKELAGYVVFEPVLDEGHITNLAVDKKYRGRGIATGLLNKVLDLAEELNVKSIFLEVKESNEAAKKLYSKFGFKQIARRKSYYSAVNEDALILRLERGKK